MNELNLESQFRASQLSQGFNPVKAPNVDPLLRERQQDQLNELSNVQKVELQDLQTQQKIQQYDQLMENENVQQIAQFSKTLWQVGQMAAKEYIKGRIAKTTEEFYQNKEQREQARTGYVEQEQGASALHTQFQLAAVDSAKAGAPYEVTKELERRSGWDQYQYAILTAKEGAANFESHADERLKTDNSVINYIDQNGIEKQVAINSPLKTRQEQQLVMSRIRQDYMADTGLSLINPGLLAEHAFPEIDKASLKLNKTAEKQYAINRGFVDRESAFGVAEDTYSTNQFAVSQYLNAVAITQSESGKTLGYPGAHKKFFEELSALYKRNPEAADAMLAQYENIELNGRKFSSLQRDRIDDFKKGIYTSQKFEREKELYNKKAVAEDAVMKGIEILQAQENYTEEDVASLIKRGQRLYAEAGLAWTAPQALQDLWQNTSMGGAELDERRKRLQLLESRNALTPEMVAREHPILKKEFERVAASQQKMREGFHADHLKEIESIVKTNPYSKAAGMDRVGGNVIVSDLQRRYSAEVNELIEGGMDRRAAADQVLSNLRTEFNEGITNTQSKYYYDPSKGGFIQYFEQNAGTFGTKRSTKDKLNTIRNLYQTLGTRALTSPEIIGTREEIVGMKNRFEAQGEIPERVNLVAKMLRVNPMKVLNEQLKAIGEDPMETYAQLLEKANQVTPAVQKQLDFVMSGAGNKLMVQRLQNDRWPVRPSMQQYVPAKGGLTGLTEQDYRDLAYVVSAEAARGGDDEYAVAASVLNRVADPRYPNTVREVMMQDRQYEAITKGIAYDDPNLVAKLSSPEGQRQIIGMLHRLQGRTDFKGQTMKHNMGPGDVMVENNGNFFHYAGQTTNSGPWTGEKPTHYMRFISNE